MNIKVMLIAFIWARESHRNIKDSIAGILYYLLKSIVHLLRKKSSEAQAEREN